MSKEKTEPIQGALLELKQRLLAQLRQAKAEENELREALAAKGNEVRELRGSLRGVDASIATIAAVQKREEGDAGSTPPEDEPTSRELLDKARAAMKAKGKRARAKAKSTTKAE